MVALGHERLPLGHAGFGLRAAADRKLPPLLRRLQGGDRRSVGQSEAVARRVRAAPELVGVLLDGALGSDPVVAMRAADALEKATRGRPSLLAPHARRILGAMPDLEQQELRWHWAQLVPRLQLGVRSRRRVTDTLQRWLSDPSRIVRVEALEALTELALRHPSLRPPVVRHVRSALRDGSPSVRARARKLAKRLQERA